MHRIDTSTAQKDKFGAGKNGFTGGNPQTGELPTALDADFFDSLQEEISRVIEAAGLTLKKSNNAQLLEAMNTLTGPGRLLNVLLFTASGSYTPSPGTKKIRVTVIGGGGGGGGAQACASGYVAAGSGGGAGGSVTKTIALSSVDPISFTVGKGGTPGNYTQNQPSDGGTSSFGSILYASGGARGNNCPAIPFGNTQLISNGGGGVGSGGDINSIGGSGGQAVILATGYTSGGGGNSSLSGGGQPIATTNSSTGIDGRYGSGASGGFVVAGDSARNGGRGGDGVIYIEEFA